MSPSETLTDEMIEQMREEAERAERTAYLDAASIGCTSPQARVIGRGAWIETVRSYLYQAGVLDARVRLPEKEGR